MSLNLRVVIMLMPRLIKRFLLATFVTFLALVALNLAVRLPVWFYLMALPAGGLLTFWYWLSFRGTEICPTCQGRGKVEVRKYRETVLDYCPSCDGEGRVPTSPTW